MKKIRITHISVTDIRGGADLAGYRLHKTLLDYPNIDSVLFVREKTVQDSEVVRFSNFFLTQAERVLNKFGYFTGLQYFFSVDWLPLLFRERFRKSDIFIIRNIHGGYLPFWFPWFLSKIAPVIWRLPDMWPLTGHCTYSYTCQKWKRICKRCPLLREYPALFLDTTPLLFKLKKFFYSKSDLYLVAPSSWMVENIKSSPILKKFPVFYIPSGVDTQLFTPGEKNKKLSIIFVSSSLGDRRKGAGFLSEIFKKLNQFLKEKNTFVDIYFAGERDTSFPLFSNINYIFLGKLKEKQLAEYYSRTHLLILPTLADNLPNTILESLSCGTPVVCFDVGGCKDVVLHLKTGYLVKPFNIDDFVFGIINLLFDSQKLELLSKKGRKLIIEKFNLINQGKQYLQLIEKILNKRYGDS